MISDSQFYMWRAVFALAHADLVITDEETDFMLSSLDTLDLSEQQRTTLENDIRDKQDALLMFQNITAADDQNEFFHLAYNLIWADGDHSPEEEHIIQKIKAYHAQRASGSEASNVSSQKSEQDPSPALDMEPPSSPPPFMDDELELEFKAAPPKDEGLKKLLSTLKESRNKQKHAKAGKPDNGKDPQNIDD